MIGKRWGFAVLLVLVVAAVPVRAAGFRIVTENLPPFNIAPAPGQAAPSGISTDLLVALFDIVGQPIDPATIEVIPWARGYKMALDQPDIVLYSTVRTSEREPLFAWLGPIDRITMAVIGLKSRNIKVREAAELENYVIGTIRNGAPEQLLKKAGVSDKNFDPISSAENNLKKLLNGRIDLFAFLVPTAQYLLLKQGQDPGAVEVVYTLKEAELYYAFPKETDPALLASLQKALEALRSRGSDGKSAYDAIVEQYLGAP